MKYFFTCFFLLQISIAFSQTKIDYTRLIDSADILLNGDAQKALMFLDSVPKPLKNHINGRIGQYYFLKGIAYDRTQQEAKIYQSYLLSLKYSQEEKDYDIAGKASLELFTNTYFIKKDTTAYKYLDHAEKFFTLSNNKNGLIEVKQMPAYVAFTEHRYEESNQLILRNLSLYRNIKDDRYYYLFATYMLASNYIHLNDLTKANIYLNEFHKLKLDETIVPYNYESYSVILNICMSKLHLDHNQLDSTLHYLSKASKSRELMSLVSTGEYFSFYSEAYKELGKTEKSLMYLDSLKYLQEKIVSDNLDANLELNGMLLDSEQELDNETSKKQNNRNWIIVLILVLLAGVILFVFRNQKFKSRSKDVILHKEDLSELQTKHEKLEVRAQELEHYITGVKDKVKLIASLKDEDAQKNNIRDLSRTINAEASSIKNSGENHINILKKLNEIFFEKITQDHPTLTDTEFLICYYLKLEFKNKEIAFFIDRSIRGVESQRYRISKKLGLENSKQLLEYLNLKY